MITVTLKDIFGILFTLRKLKKISMRYTVSEMTLNVLQKRKTKIIPNTGRDYGTVVQSIVSPENNVVKTVHRLLFAGYIR